MAWQWNGGVPAAAPSMTAPMPASCWTNVRRAMVRRLRAPSHTKWATTALPKRRITARARAMSSTSCATRARPPWPTPACARKSSTVAARTSASVVPARPTTSALPATIWPGISPATRLSGRSARCLAASGHRWPPMAPMSIITATITTPPWCRGCVQPNSCPNRPSCPGGWPTAWERARARLRSPGPWTRTGTSTSSRSSPI